MLNDEIKSKILNYGYYDETDKYTIVLNEEYLKELFQCDNIYLKELYNMRKV